MNLKHGGHRHYNKEKKKVIILGLINIDYGYF